MLARPNRGEDPSPRERDQGACCVQEVPFPRSPLSPGQRPRVQQENKHGANAPEWLSPWPRLRHTGCRLFGRAIRPAGWDSGLLPGYRPKTQRVLGSVPGTGDSTGRKTDPAPALTDHNLAGRQGDGKGGVKRQARRNFPAGPVVKHPPCKAGDTGSSPGWGTKTPQALGQLNL